MRARKRTAKPRPQPQNLRSVVAERGEKGGGKGSERRWWPCACTQWADAATRHTILRAARPPHQHRHCTYHLTPVSSGSPSICSVRTILFAAAAASTSDAHRGQWKLQLALLRFRVVHVDRYDRGRVGRGRKMEVGHSCAEEESDARLTPARRTFLTLYPRRQPHSTLTGGTHSQVEQDTREPRPPEGVLVSGIVS